MITPSIVKDGEARSGPKALVAIPEFSYQDVFEHSGIGLAILSLDGVLLEVNQIYAKILGRSPQDLVGRLCADFTHPDDVEPDREVRGEALRNKKRRYSME